MLIVQRSQLAMNMQVCFEDVLELVAPRAWLGQKFVSGFRTATLSYD
jgi:hypothetical protein